VDGRLSLCRQSAVLEKVAFVQTGERTVMSYLTKPLRDQIDRAFREK
jgi:hypothetical protein